MWVRRAYGVQEYPGLVLEWLDDERRARVTYVDDDGRVFTEVVEAFFLAVLDVQPSIGSMYG